MPKFKIYLKSILIPVIVGGVVGFLISNSMDYNSLIKPPFSPPRFLFPIIWTILYILMGVSYGILKSNSLIDENSDFIYYLQLFVNVLWPIFFFLLKWRLFSFFWIVFLVILIILWIINFYKKKRISGLLQIPYLLWSVFATYLTIAIYLLNRV